jgi:MinD superfamily P-loop ATPase
MTKYEAHISYECNACGECIEVCESNVFGMNLDGEVWSVHPENCDGCRMCLDVCFQGAISINEISD